MQAALNALANVHRAVVTENFFESTPLREPSGETLASGEESALRRGYTVGIRKALHVEKLIDECLEKVQLLSEKARAKERGSWADASHLAAEETAAASKSGGKKRQRAASGSRSAKAASKSSCGRTHTAPAQRPPHMDRAPLVKEVVAAKIASHELWITAVVQRISNGSEGTLFQCVAAQCRPNLPPHRASCLLPQQVH